MIKLKDRRNEAIASAATFFQELLRVRRNLATVLERVKSAFSEVVEMNKELYNIVSKC